MTKSGFLCAFAAIALTACGPRVPPARGVGFDDFSNYELERARREAALSGQSQSIVPAPQINTIDSSGTDQAIPSSELAAAGIGTDTSLDPNRVLGVDASPTNAAPTLVTDNPGISDEQSFDAVSGRETIESDAERRAAQAAAREQIEPTALPSRPSNTGPNIVEYALNAPNVKGQEWYSRSILSGESRFQRNCAAYATPDDAQRDFMSRGGPERDRLGIDPDGDGFACGWDPAPFIAAFQN
ncbi:hypothetical protein [Yoonia sp. BS5-3]|uniref:Excalibur calcium-binding domain-containing protein n=1 Tax=Yoonia phaeophyticola TaxID=3137369 RepID=A0ABZ2V992_9RHOB